MIREYYISQLQKLGKYFPVIGIIGPRQVGKTTLAKQFISYIEKETLLLDLEKPSDYEKLNNPELYLKQHEDKCIIIDEVQIRPELFAILRSLIDENRVPLRFIILGSASPDIIRNTSESLAGRIAYIELMPFNLKELSGIAEIRKQHFFGGFPDSILAKNSEASVLWIDNFLKTYVERDLPLLGMSANPILVRRLWEMLSWQNANVLNYSSIGKSLGITHNTVRNYIDFLEGAFLINRVQAFFVNVKKRIVKSPKVYIADTGLLHRLLRINSYDELFGNPVLGASWETFVYNQISGLKNNDIDIFYYRTHAGTEIDLILVKALIPVASIEIKFSASPKVTKSLVTGINDLQTEKNFIIVPNSEDYLIRENIRVCNITDFIIKYLPDF
ncbi:MAG: ATP-binding protein [Bacteroidales bacterium]|nr:ATP-binding protein [Bacteroidales bacterium]